MKKTLLSFLTIAALAIFSSCEGPIGPEGPTGAAGADGTNGTDGKDMNETCKLCHKNGGDGSVDSIAIQFELSKHSYGEAAFEEAGNTGCTPCHASEAFQDVVRRNVPSTFTLSGATYVNSYSTQSHTAYGELLCGTCHNKIHATYGSSDIPSLTTVAPVSMTMWGGAKTINLTQDGGSSNLCVKCHQPRPFVKSSGDRNLINYADLVANPTAVFYDAARTTGTNVYTPSYRSHTHYGTAGAVYAGQGGIEFTGTKTYGNSGHTTLASCQDCHMAKVTGRAGGHTFTAKGNFNGCNVTGCHTTPITAASTNMWLTPRAAIKKLLDDLAAKLKIGGVDILNRNANTSETAMILNANGQTVSLGVNLWAGLTTNNYDGYLNVYDPITNPGAQTYNTSSFQFNGTPPATWSQAQKDYNATLPKITLTNAQMGAIINFQMCLRDYSLGIHNYKYVEALLTNTIATLP